MRLQHPSSSVVSLAATTIAILLSTPSVIVTAQDAIACLASAGDFETCCPAIDLTALSADPTDGVCTLLGCLDLEVVSLRDGCFGSDIDTACEQVAMFASVVAELPAMCTSVALCSETSNDNDAWDACMKDAESAGNHTLPNFSMLLPAGGIPTFDDDNSLEVEEEAEEAVDEGEMTLPTEEEEAAEQETTMTASTPPVSSTSATVASEIGEQETGGVDPEPTTTTAIATVSPEEDEDDEATTTSSSSSPPASFMCLAAGLSSEGGPNIDSCCPEGSADTGKDGFCTLYGCINLTTYTIQDECQCQQIITALNQLMSTITPILPEITGAFDALVSCCDDSGGDTSNEDFDVCVQSAVAGGTELPDLNVLIPGGMPILEDGAAVVDTTTTVGATEASPTSDITEAPLVTPTTPIVPTTTEAPPPVTEEASGGSNMFAKTVYHMSLVLLGIGTIILG